MKLYYSLLVILITITSCSNPRDLEYQDVKHFRLLEVSMSPKVGMDVQFFNPNKYGMTMKDANVDLYVNGKHIGNAFLEKSYQIPGLDTFLLPVSFKADLKNILPNALAILSNSKVDVELKGHVKAGKGVFVNIPIRYKGEQELNLTGM